MFKVKKFFGWFSFKKFVAIGLSCVMFLQCSSLSFASENNNVNLIENSTERIATQHKDGKYYVAKFDKKTKILIQNTYIEGTNKLVDTIKCDLNPKNMVTSNNLKSSNCYTLFGYGYSDDKDVTCKSPDGNYKMVLYGISNQSQFDRAYSFEDKVLSLKDSQNRVQASIIGLLIYLILPEGKLINDLTDAMLKAAGVGEVFWGGCFDIHAKCKECQAAYDRI